MGSLSRWDQCNHNSSYKGGRRVRVRQEDVMMGAEVRVILPLALKIDEGYEPRNVRPLETEKGK